MNKSNSYPIEKPLEGLESFYDDFLVNRNKELQKLKTALTEKNFDFIAEVAHRWKGFCGPYGFGQLANIAKEIESCATQKKLAECGEFLHQAEDYLKHKATAKF